MQLKGRLKGVKEKLLFRVTFYFLQKSFYFECVYQVLEEGGGNEGDEPPSRQPSNPNIFGRFYCIMQAECIFFIKHKKEMLALITYDNLFFYPKTLDQCLMHSRSQ